MIKKKKLKDTKASIYEIKNYERIRLFLHNIFFEPNMNKEQMNKFGIKKRTYYNILKNIKLYLKNNMQSSKINSSMNYHIIHDLYKCSNNFYADTYMYSSYVITDIFYYILILQILNNNDEIKYDEIINMFKDQEFIDNEINKIKPRIKELVDLGIILETVKNTYKLMPDILDSIDDMIENILYLHDYYGLSYLLEIVIFYYNYHFFSTPGYFITKIINQMDIINNNSDEYFTTENNIFVFRYNPIHNTIYNDILWDILTAIKDKKLIQYKYKHINEDKTVSICSYSMIPSAIILEYEYGKQYCYGYSKQLNEYIISRVDMMSEININTAGIDDNKYFNHNPDIIESAWNVSTIKNNEKVEIMFHIPGDNKTILRRINNTKRHGILKKIHSEKYIFTIEVNDSLELVPWVNSFGHYAVVNKEISPQLYNKIMQHNEELRQMYEII